MSEYIQTDDTVRFSLNTYNQSTGKNQTADSDPKWYVFEDDSDTSILDGIFTERASLSGCYRSSFVASSGNGFYPNSYYEVYGSGTVDSVTAWAPIRSFVLDDPYIADIRYSSGIPIVQQTVIDANVIQVSGEPVVRQLVVDSNIVKVSGDPVGINDFKYSDQNIYFADISHIYDGTNSQDEYSVQWFKDAQPVASGELTNPSLSVYNTSDGSAVLSNQSMNYASTTLGVVRHNEATSVLASGEPYLVTTSGTIDSQVRTWKSIVGTNVF